MVIGLNRCVTITVSIQHSGAEPIAIYSEPYHVSIFIMCTLSHVIQSPLSLQGYDVVTTVSKLNFQKGDKQALNALALCKRMVNYNHNF